MRRVLIGCLGPAWLACCTALWLAPAVADEGRALVLAEVEFSAEHGGIRLLDGWGQGSLVDPYVVVEEIVEGGAAILTIRNLRSNFGQRSPSGQSVGFVLKKIVTNRTGRPWTAFEMELREDPMLASDYFDGLSFGQAKDRTGYVRSDRFPSIVIADEPADAISFSGTTIGPGETVEVQVTITDHSPRDVFFLLQRREAPVAMR